MAFSFPSSSLLKPSVENKYVSGSGCEAQRKERHPCLLTLPKASTCVNHGWKGPKDRREWRWSRKLFLPSASRPRSLTFDPLPWPQVAWISSTWGVTLPSTAGGFGDGGLFFTGVEVGHRPSTEINELVKLAVKLVATQHKAQSHKERIVFQPSKTKASPF